MAECATRITEETPANVSLTAVRAEYQEASADYARWARIEDRLTANERRQKEAAGARADRAWAALRRAKR